MKAVAAIDVCAQAKNLAGTEISVVMIAFFCKLLLPRADTACYVLMLCDGTSARENGD